MVTSLSFFFDAEYVTYTSDLPGLQVAHDSWLGVTRCWPVGHTFHCQLLCIWWPAWLQCAISYHNTTTMDDTIAAFGPCRLLQDLESVRCRGLACRACLQAPGQRRSSSQLCAADQRVRIWQVRRAEYSRKSFEKMWLLHPLHMSAHCPSAVLVL